VVAGRRFQVRKPTEAGTEMESEMLGTRFEWDSSIQSVSHIFNEFNNISSL
jgi:hypothetical protein